MAVIDFHTPVSVFSSLSQRALHFPANIAHLVLDWNRSRQTRQQLLTLTDKELCDIGLTREMVSAMKFTAKDS